MVDAFVGWRFDDYWEAFFKVENVRPDVRGEAHGRGTLHDGRAAARARRLQANFSGAQT